MELNKIDILIEAAIADIKKIYEEFKPENELKIIGNYKSIPKHGMMELQQNVEDTSKALNEFLESRFDVYIVTLKNVGVALKKQRLTKMRVKKVFMSLWAYNKYVKKRFINSCESFKDTTFYKIAINDINQHSLRFTQLCKELEIKLLAIKE
jgi:hypothetical protein